MIINQVQPGNVFFCKQLYNLQKFILQGRRSVESDVSNVDHLSILISLFIYLNYFSYYLFY
jgi:hypothetical protein